MSAAATLAGAASPGNRKRLRASIVQVHPLGAGTPRPVRGVRKAQAACALTTLQDYRIESGEPSGELKITEVPGLPENETAQATENDPDGPIPGFFRY
jgi:hypothetical protein